MEQLLKANLAPSWQKRATYVVGRGHYCGGQEKSSLYMKMTCKLAEENVLGLNKQDFAKTRSLTWLVILSNLNDPPYPQIHGLVLATKIEICLRNLLSEEFFYFVFMIDHS